MLGELLESREETWVLQPANQTISECLYQADMRRALAIERNPRLGRREAVTRLGIEVVRLVGKSPSRKLHENDTLEMPGRHPQYLSRGINHGYVQVDTSTRVVATEEPISPQVASLR